MDHTLNSKLVELSGEQIYTSLFRNHPDAVCAVSREGLFVLANTACQHVTGYTLDEFVELHFTDLITDDKQVRIVRFKQALSGISQKCETAIVHKDGHIIDVHVTLVPISIDGNIVGVFGIIKDISDQKKTEQNLRKKRAIIKLFSEGAHDIIAVINRYGVTERMSSSIKTTLGYDPEKVIGKPAIDYWHVDDADLMARHLFSDSAFFESRVRHKHGHYVWFEAAFNTIRNEKGQVELTVAVGRDITKRKRAELKLLETKEQLDSFVEHHVDAIVSLTKKVD